MGRIFNNDNQQQQSSNFSGGRLSKSGKMKEPTKPENVFVNFIKEMGKGVARDVVSFGMSSAELARPSNIFRKPTSKAPAPWEKTLKIFGEDVGSIQRNIDIATSKYKRGEINKKQLLGEAGSEALTSLAVAPIGETANIVKQGAKQTFSQIAKRLGKQSVKYGGSFGLASGATEAMKQNAPWKEVGTSSIKGAGVGSVAMFGLGAGGHAIGKVIGKKIGKSPLSERVSEIKKKYEPKREVETQTKKRKKVDIMNIIKNDKDITIREENGKIKIPGRNKFATGKYKYNFKRGTGEIVIKKGAKPSSIAHEYAHHKNFKLGDGDKFSNRLANYIEGRGKKPKALGNFDAKLLQSEIKKASRIGRNVESRLTTTSEEFATAVSNAMERPRDVERTAPLFSKFVKEKILGENKSRIKKPIIIDPDKFKKQAFEKGDRTAYSPKRHEEFSIKAKKEFKKQLKQNSNPFVKLTAGGSGSGKSELVLSRISKNHDGIVLDGTMANLESATSKLKQIADAGKKAKIYYILPRIESSWKFVQKRALKTGRNIPLDVFIEKHLGALNTLKKLAKKGVPIYLKDTRNVWSKTEAKYMPFEKNRKIILDKLSKIEYTKSELERKLKNVRLSKKTRRKVLAEIEDKRRGVREGSKGIKQSRKNSRSLQSKHKMASRRGADLESAKAGKVKPSQKKDGFVVGKKIKWSKSEDIAVEKYIRSKGINKARKSAKLQELQAHYKRLQKQWDNASIKERKNISKAIADTQRQISRQKFRKDKKEIIQYQISKAKAEGKSFKEFIENKSNDDFTEIKPELVNVNKLKPTNKPNTRTQKILSSLSEASKDPIIINEKFEIMDGNNRYVDYIRRGIKEIPTILELENRSYINIKTKSKLRKMWDKSKTQKFRTEKIQTIAGKKLTERQYKKITEFNKKLFGDENVKITKQIMTPEGQKALGVYSDGMIKIMKGQVDPKDTYYHEVVHKYLDVMTTMSEHKEALIAAKKHFKSKTFEQAEEDLAEAFINYAKKREGVTGALRRVFDKVLNRIKKVEANKETIGDFYSKILERKLETKPSTKPITPKNIPKKFIPRKKDKTKFTEKLNTGKAVDKLVRKLEKSDEVKREIQKRGVVSWDETTKQAEEMGIDVKEIKKEAKTASDFAAQIEAVKQLRANKASELHDFLSQAPRNPTEKQKAEIAQKIDEFLFVDRSLKSISTEHGRAINILKKEVQAQEFETYNDLIDEIIKVDPKKAGELEYVKKIDKIINKDERILNALGLSRSMMTTADLSAPMRQGVFVAPRHPVLFGKAVKDMFKQALSEDYYQKSIKKIKESKNYPLMKKNGLALTELDEELTKREEAVISNLPEKIPGFGRIARGSNRAYTGFLNKLRADYFDNLVNTMKIVDKNIPEDRMKSLTRYINSATGRGDLPKYIEKHADLLNASFFSPRLIASRMNLLNPHYYYKLDPYVRKEALKDLFAFVGAGATVLSLAKLGGAEVGADPRSADFGKIKIGNTRFDIWGGFQQYAVLASRLISGEMVSSTTGREFQLGEGYKPTTRGDILQRFFSYKTSPVTSFAIGLLNGKNTMGKDFDFPVEVSNRMIPMVISDMYDLMKEKKPVSYALPAVFGVGVQTYSDKIPFKGRTKSGKKKIVWKERPGLGEDVVNLFRGVKETSIPKNRWKPLYRKKLKEDRKKAEFSNAKREVLKTGKTLRLNGKRIFLQNGVVKVK